MSEKEITQKSRNFYEKFQFPGNRPIDRDGLIFLRRFSGSIKDCSKNNKVQTLRVLDAGCGTGNTSVSLAGMYRNIEFYGVDNSKASLEKAKKLSSEKGLSNIHFRKWNLLKPLPYTRKFDIVLCLGVLHHTANMKKVLLNLNKCLKNNGKLYLWIYAKHGRYKHSLNMRFLDMLINAKPKTKDEIHLAKEFLNQIHKINPLEDLTGDENTAYMQKKTIEDPVWIADQFLNPHEILIDMETLIGVVDSAGFEFENLLGFNEDISEFTGSKILLNKFRRLNKADKLIALDLLIKPERYFVCLNKTASKRGNSKCLH